jgi:hypothetical protein
MAYQRLTGQNLAEWVRQLLIDRSDVAFKVEHVQSAIVRRGYAAPTLQEIRTVLDELVARGFAVKPWDDLYQFKTTSWGERAPENTVGSNILKALVEHTINDITMDEMNRIVRRLNRMSRSDRDAPVRVGQVIADELGEQKALKYIENALANGLIKRDDYEKMRAAILLRMPRTEIPAPWAGAGAQQLLEGQKKIQQDLGRIRQLGLSSLEKASSNLNKDIERIKRAWGL